MQSSSSRPGPHEIEAEGGFATIVDRVVAGHERVVLTRGGEPYAAVVPLEDMAALEAFEDARDAAELRGRLADWRGAAGTADAAVIPLAEVAHRLGVTLGGTDA